MPHKIEVSTTLLVSRNTVKKIELNLFGVARVCGETDVENNSDVRVIVYLDLDDSVPDGFLIDKIRRSDIAVGEFFDIVRGGVVSVRYVPAVPLIESDVSILKAGIDAPPDGVARVYSRTAIVVPQETCEKIKQAIADNPQRGAAVPIYPTFPAMYRWQKRRGDNEYYFIPIIDRRGEGSSTLYTIILDRDGRLLLQASEPEARDWLAMSSRRATSASIVYYSIVDGSEEHAALLEWIKGEGKPK